MVLLCPLPMQPGGSMRRLHAMLSLCLFAACGGEVFGPEVLAGTYDLVSLDDQPAPVVLLEGADSKLLMDATLNISGTTWILDAVSRMVTLSTGDTNLVSESQLAVGSWGGTEPGSLTFTGRGPSGTNFGGSGVYETATGTLRLTISGSGLGSVFAFARR
jgi:hypothetical protein